MTTRNTIGDGPTTVLRELPVRLTAEEVSEKAAALAQGIGEAERMDEAKKLAAQAHKEQWDALQAEIRRLGRLVRDGVEQRQVECEERSVWTTGVVETWRLDTGERIDSRPMSAAERQRSLDVGPGN